MAMEKLPVLLLIPRLSRPCSVFQALGKLHIHLDVDKAARVNEPARRADSALPT